MTTDLFAAVSGIAARRVRDAIPPACRRSIDTAPRAAFTSGQALVEFPPWTPRRPSLHFVPALSLLRAADYSLRFELTVECAGVWSPWVPSAVLGSATFPALSGESEALRCDVDVFVATMAAARVRLRIRVQAEDIEQVLNMPWLASLSACDLSPLVVPDEVAGRAALPVPVRSQMEAPVTLRSRICSPTSVAMVLQWWGRDVEPAEAAADVFHPELDLYGVWPAAIRAAARRGVPGYLLRFPDWSSAAWCLDQGLPVVASVRYEAGELTGAALAETRGHLLVVTGYERGSVLVHDPAALTRATVARRYPLDEFRRVWLDRAGLGYVFFAPDA